MTPSELLAGLIPEQEPPDEFTPKQRLLYGARISKVPTTPGPVRVAEDVGSASNVNLAARKAQYQETSPSPDPESVWRKLQKPVLRGRSGQLLDQLKAGSALKEPDWDELKVSLHEVDSSIQDVDDDLTVGKGQVSNIYQSPTGTWFTVDYPPDMEPADLPASLTGRPTGNITPEVLEWPSNGEFSVMVGPSDVVYAARDTDENRTRLRGLVPGPLGKDGIPRWVPVQPVEVPSTKTVEAQALADPSIMIDSYVGRNDYPGTKGGDWIVWDVPEPDTPRGWRPPVWMQGKAQKIKAGVASSQPKYSLNPVPKDKIVDQQTLDARLGDTSWAVFEAQGDPQRTSHIISRLKNTAHDPIELDSEGRRAWLVFGVDPATAREMSPKRPVYTNDGVLADEEPEAKIWSFRSPSGLVKFQSQVGIASGASPRALKRAERWAYRADPSQPDRLGGLANDLEAQGGTNVSIYGRQLDLEGFTRDLEHLYTDGSTLKVVRGGTHADESNTVPVFVRQQ